MVHKDGMRGIKAHAGESGHDDSDGELYSRGPRATAIIDSEGKTISIW